MKPLEQRRHRSEAVQSWWRLRFGGELVVVAALIAGEPFTLPLAVALRLFSDLDASVGLVALTEPSYRLLKVLLRLQFTPLAAAQSYLMLFCLLTSSNYQEPHTITNMKYQNASDTNDTTNMPISKVTFHRPRIRRKPLFALLAVEAASSRSPQTISSSQQSPLPPFLQQHNFVFISTFVASSLLVGFPLC